MLHSPCTPQSVTCDSPSRAQHDASHTGRPRQLPAPRSQRQAEYFRNAMRKKRGFSWGPGTPRASARPRLISRACRQVVPPKAWPSRTRRTRTGEHRPAGTTSSRGLFLGSNVLLGFHHSPLKANEVLVSFIDPTEGDTAKRRLPATGASRTQPPTAESRRRGRAPDTGEPFLTCAPLHSIKIQNKHSNDKFDTSPGKCNVRDL